MELSSARASGSGKDYFNDAEDNDPIDLTSEFQPRLSHGSGSGEDHFDYEEDVDEEMCSTPQFENEKTEEWLKEIKKRIHQMCSIIVTHV